MTTDRELLEAAYAAYRPGENYTRLVNDAGSDYWNPLADDGDALLEALKLAADFLEHSTEFRIGHPGFEGAQAKARAAIKSVEEGK
jgi:hypothetical protein